MDFYLIARQQVEHSMTEQFRDTPHATERASQPAPRTGIVTTLRLRLSTDLRALAAAIEPRTPLAAHPGPSRR
jgi:hypothetical protein